MCSSSHRLVHPVTSTTTTLIPPASLTRSRTRHMSCDQMDVHRTHRIIAGHSELYISLLANVTEATCIVPEHWRCWQNKEGNGEYGEESLNSYHLSMKCFLEVFFLFLRCFVCYWFFFLGAWRSSTSEREERENCLRYVSIRYKVNIYRLVFLAFFLNFFKK